MIDIKDLCKYYLVGEERVRALDHATLHIYPQEFVSIIGPSGSGKSTMMNIIGCLDIADAGEYLLDGLPIESYSENQLAKIRNEKIGFVFQQYNLIPKLTAEENVELPLIYQKVPKKERTERVKEALERVDMYKPAHGAVRRTAAACFHRPGHRHPAQADSGGRAYGRSGLQDQQGNHRHFPRAAFPGQHHCTDYSR